MLGTALVNEASAADVQYWSDARRGPSFEALLPVEFGSASTSSILKRSRKAPDSKRDAAAADNLKGELSGSQ
jgi:hypothetical protein